MSAHRPAKKSLGQNFLIDPNQQRRIVAALEPEPGDTILEIGPGRGALTRHLVDSVEHLVLVELDDDLAADLAREFRDRRNVTILHADVLAIDLGDIIDDPARLRVVGNIPYNITTPIIFRLLQQGSRPRRVVLMIQREVAERILAPAGSGEYGALSVGVRAVADVVRLFHVGRQSFRPVPRVDSTVIRIDPIDPPPLSVAEEADLRELTRATFSWRRKQLQKTLREAPGYRLDAGAVARVADVTGIAMDQRPEQLEPERFIRLSRALRRLGLPQVVHEAPT
ncbi:MAG TPA: 16S rRNA (adenine(1518)-N(6)/adenine(1519)-N(6))-dimethyltransferase RsmA [Longimicrobiales bacterium]|nr:16S rRNA (adenine(1518)-N(6)/adenine(1519)-N(6))-dimethyltransferase RsmA [Longimicrobiales bacterium]